jgi:NAD(P)-dependent dehydrogenase (short-subunit alcohol dehydrogenase family)
LTCKYAIEQMLAVEWATRGIRVNAVAPRTINTERVQRLPEEPAGPEYLESIKAAHPMGRLGEPSEVAEAILFLASDKASFITGAILPVDGGFLAQQVRPSLTNRSVWAGVVTARESFCGGR